MRLGGGLCHQEAHIIGFSAFLAEEIVERKVIQESLCAVDAVAVLVVVGGVIGIRHNNHIILGGFGAHGIVADNHLPVSAPVVPADGDGVAFFQGLLDEVKGEHIVDGVPAVQGGINIKAAHALEHLHHLRHGGSAGGQTVAAELGQGFFVVVAPHSVPFQHHQCAADTAAPFAGLLLGLEMGENGQAVGAFHVIEIRALK